MLKINEIHCGDTRELLKQLPDESIQCCVTSPPYWGLRDYGHDNQIGLEKTPEEYVQNMVKIFREVQRVLRQDGTLWLNLGDTYAAARSYQVTDNKHKDVGNKIGHSVPPGLKPKDIVGIPWRVAFALQADGWYLRQDIIWHKPNPMPESVTDRCTKSHEYIFLLSKSAQYYYDHETTKEPAGEKGNANSFRGGAYCNGNKDNATLGKRTVSGNTKKRPSKKKGSFNGKTEAMASTGQNAFRAVTDDRNKRSVWTVATKPFKKAHFATFPPKLIEPCILAGCPQGGIVIDPFAGAGTTAFVSVENNRQYIGLELNPEYCKIARQRISQAQPQLF